MPTALFRFIFNVYILLIFIHLTIANNDANSYLQLDVYPNSGYSVENIGIRCEILKPSIYDNVYLSVKSDYVKPSGILIMVDDTVNQCRINEIKEQYIDIHSCNSSLILIHIRHQILNDSVHTINYACSQGDIIVYKSYRILKEQIARYYDQKSSSSSSLLTYSFYLLIFVLVTLKEVR